MAEDSFFLQNVLFFLFLESASYNYAQSMTLYHHWFMHCPFLLLFFLFVCFILPVFSYTSPPSKGNHSNVFIYHLFGIELTDQIQDPQLDMNFT